MTSLFDRQFPSVTSLTLIEPAPPPNERADWEWMLGIILCLGGAAATNLGLTIQKLSFLRNDAAEPAQQKQAMRQPLWISGLAVFLLGQVLNLIAFGYTGQALAATLGSFSLVTNGFFAPLLLGEKLTKTIMISIVVIVSGSIITVFASSHATQDYTLEELITLYKRDLFIGYMSILVVAFTICIILMWREHLIWKAASKKLEAWEAEQEARSNLFDPRVPEEASIGDGKLSLQEDPEMQSSGHTISSERDALIGEQRLSPPAELRVTPPTPVTPILAGAILSSLSVLFGKCTVQLAKASFYGSNEFVHPLSWFLTVIFLVCATAAVVFLNLGLHRGQALFVVPLYYVLNTVLAILGGLIYFEEFQRFTPLQGLIFGTGVITTVIGVFVGSRGQVSLEDGEAEMEEITLSASPESVSSQGSISVSPPVMAVNGTQAISVPLQPSASGEPASVAPASKPKRGSLSRKAAAALLGTAPVVGVGGTKVVRFGGVDTQADHSSSVEPPTNTTDPRATTRFARAASASDVGLTDQEFQQLLDETDAQVAAATAAAAGNGVGGRAGAGLTVAATAASGSSNGSAGTLALHPALSTPQHSSRGYGSVDSSVSVPFSSSRTPSAPQRSQTQRRPPMRQIDLSKLTPAQQAVIRKRHAQLAAVGRRYSFAQDRYQSSFSSGEHHRPERRYSVAVLGLGVS